MTENRHGTIIHGTLRHEDLIPAFISALEDAIEEDTFLPGADDPAKVRLVGERQSRLGEIERSADVAGYYDGEDADWDLEWLFDSLDDVSPVGFRFGSHEGDGSDFGWWAVDA